MGEWTRPWLRAIYVNCRSARTKHPEWDAGCRCWWLRIGLGGCGQACGAGQACAQRRGGARRRAISSVLGDLTGAVLQPIRNDMFGGRKERQVRVKTLEAEIEFNIEVSVQEIMDQIASVT